MTILLLKRGLEANLPPLPIGNPAFTTDTKRLFFGSDKGNLDLTHGIFDVKHFGAKGDGVTDDTVSIQLALDSASFRSSSEDGALVVLPLGTYLISDTLRVPSNVSLRGVGRRGSTLKLKPGATCDAMILRPGGSDGYWVQLRDFCLDGQASLQTNSTSGIRLEDSFEGLIDNVGIRFVTNHGIHVKGTSSSSVNNTIRNCVIRADKDHHTAEASGIFLDSNSYDGMIHGNDIGYYSNGYGIHTNGHNGAVLSDNNVWQCKRGYFLEYSNRLRFSNCLSDYAMEYGFFSSGGGEFQFANCQSRWSGCKTPNLYDGFHFYNVGDFTFTGCVTLSGDGTNGLTGIGTGQTKFGIALTGTTNHAKIYGFHFKNCSEIYQDATVSAITKV